ncbi:MAG TPA: alpha/beta fold hydrolase [Candidatus Acidoferrales bacterium]|nr:alpha/beta fold hydrolase [Candidatus Acidoferrales bacterium]
MRRLLGTLIAAILGIAWFAAPARSQQTSQRSGQQASQPAGQQARRARVNYPTKEGDYIIHNFHFESGETMPELRMHYLTLGQPQKDANGRTTNAVLILHGTTGSGRQFLSPSFAGVLYGPGQLLDITKYYLILPDNIGHGKSSKPSDGMRAHFPQYDYQDMVKAQHDLLENGLGVNHLRLVMGTSMGCMHSFMWGEMYPDDVDALMPLACEPVQIAGRNRMWRKMLMDAIHADPAWDNGDYKTEPVQGMRTVIDLMAIAGSAPLEMQVRYPTRDAADAVVVRSTEARLKAVESGSFDANDVWYAFNSSRTYDPSPDLEKIKAPLMWVNSADDFINPPDLGIAEREIKRVKRGKYVLIPESDKTRGHGTHTMAIFWQQYMKELLDESQH